MGTARISVVFAADTYPEANFTEQTPAFSKVPVPAIISQCSSREAWAFKQRAMAVSIFLLAAAAHDVQTCPMEGFVSIEAVANAVGLDPARY